LGPPGQRFGPDMDSPSSPEFTTTESLIHQPYSAPPSDDHPSDIYLYSNYNVRVSLLNHQLLLTNFPLVHGCQTRTGGVLTSSRH
jgi:hypothetical protein